MSKSQAQAIRHLDERYSMLRGTLHLFERPYRGWLKAIRQTLGMTTQQAATRMGVSRPRISALEQDELKGSLTLATLERAAQALGCRLIYALVPEESLQTTVEVQAQRQADALLKRAGHTMSLEAQATSQQESDAQRQRLINDFLEGNPARLWDPLP